MATATEQEDKAIIITGASIKDDMFGKYSYSKTVAKGIVDKCTVNSQLPIHDDFKAAVRKMNNHLAAICEEVSTVEMDDVDNVIFCPKDQDPVEFEKALEGLAKKLFMFQVTGFSLDGTGENAGITLTGRKKLGTGDWLQLTTPKICWESNYYFINELRIASDDLVHEVEAYMDGKQAPRAIQTEIDFDNPNGEGEQEGKTFIVGGPKGKKGKGKKGAEEEFEEAEVITE